MAGLTLDYTASKTMAHFHASEDFVRGVMGPYGSGKTSGCCMEIFLRSMAQEPARVGEYNVRKTRWAIIRNTYRELLSTTLKTWTEWFPPDICPVKKGILITSEIKQRLGDGTYMDAEIIFLAMDRPEDIKKLLSLELTGAFMNEARELPREILDAATARVGRFPAKRSGCALTWSGIIMDTNPPDDGHWYYKLAEIERPEGFRFWRQPGAMILRDDGNYIDNPLAENVEHQQLGGSYWRRLLAGKSQEWIKVYILGEYGSVFSGRPVYEEFNDSFHVSKESLQVMGGIPIYLGWDFGLTPACIAMQISPSGQLRLLREWVCERGGIREFSSRIVKPAIINEFPGMQIISFGDPAGAAASQVNHDTSCIDELCRQGIYTEPAITNDFDARRQSVQTFLMRAIDGDTPGLILDPQCSVLRRGFNGGYRYDRVATVGGAEVRYRDRPAKNMFSHPHDALQYGALAVDSGFNSVSRLGTAWPEPAVTMEAFI